MTSTPSQNPVWSMVSATLLLGFTIVSGVDLALPDHSEVAGLQLAEIVAQESSVVVIAPGGEHVLGDFYSTERLRVAPPWERLPVQPTPYLVLLWDSVELPRTPLAWETSDETLQGRWQLVHLRPQTISLSQSSLSDFLPQAVVSFEKNEEITPCDQWSFGFWECGIYPWLRVGLDQLTFDGEDHECISAHPLAGQTLRIRFPEVPAGERIIGRYGLSDEAVAASGRSVEFRVRVGDNVERLRAHNRTGFLPYSVDIPEDFDPSDGVQFEVFVTEDRMRRFCFTAGIETPPTLEEAESL